MATYVNNLRLKEIATGDESGTWGTSTNTNLELIGEALGFGTEAITTNADTHTTTVADGSSDAGRSMYLQYTGTLDSACTITIAPNTMKRMQFIENGTSGSQNIIISQGSGANVTIAPGDVKAVYLDGAGSGAAVVDAFTDLNLAGTTKMAGFTSSVASTITTADNTDTLSLISTDADANAGPNLRMYRNSSSAADDDFLGEIQFEGRNDNSEDVIYGQILTRIRDASDGTEDAQLTLKTMVAGTARNRLEFNEGEAVFNDDAIDVNFRVESDSVPNMLFVDGSADAVGIGTGTPGDLLHITNGDRAVDTRIRLDAFGQLPMFNVQFAAGTSSSPTAATSGTELLRIASTPFDGSDYSQSAVNIRVVAEADFSSNSCPAHLAFDTNSTTRLATEKMRLDKDGKLGLGVTSLGNGKLIIGSDEENHIRLENSSELGLIGIADDGEFVFHVHGDNSTDVFKFLTGSGAGTERVRIDNSGNVGIGDAPNVSLEVVTSDPRLRLRDNTAGGGSGNGGKIEFAGFHASSSDGTRLFAEIHGLKQNSTGGDTHGHMLFLVNTGSVSPSEVARFDHDGALRINNTSTIGSNDEGVLHLLGKSAHTVCKMKVTSNSQRYIHFFDASNNDAGSVQNGGGASTVYNTSSDYRMKEDFRPLENGLERLSKLNPIKFKWKHYDIEQEGFLAHEAQEVFPDAVTGDKDGIDKYGKPEMQQMDYGRITPLLVKAIQEQQEQIEQLKKQIETLQ